MQKELLEVLVRNLNNLLKDKKINDLSYFDEEFVAKYTYDAISMEGRNKIPYEKIKVLIEHKQIPNYSEREIKEVLNHVKCYEKICEWSKTKKDLSEEDIKDLHHLLEDEIYIGGVYRNVNISINEAQHQPPNYIKVYDRMKRLFDDIITNDFSYLEKGVFIHAHLAKIHPFLDGNGRLGRLVLNFYLMKAGYLPISIAVSEREAYFKTIDEFKINRDIKPLTSFVINKLVERYELELKNLEN